MSRSTDQLLSFHRPRGMSCSHYRNVVRNRCHQANYHLCLKPMWEGRAYCLRRKGHQGECDDIPF